MRLLHSCETLSRSFGGVFEVVRQLSTAQLVRHPDWTIRAIGAWDEAFVEDQHSWGQNIAIPYRLRGPASLGYSPYIKDQYRSIRPELTHVHGLWKYFGIANLRQTKAARIPYVVSPHGMLDQWALKQGSWKKWLFRKLFENRQLANAGCIHALCAEEAASIRSLGFQNPICIIPNGVIEPVSLPDRAVKVDGPKTLLFLGRLHPKKGLDVLLDAWSRVQRGTTTKEDCLLKIAGWGEAEYVGHLKKLVEKRGVSASVQFVGSVFGQTKVELLQEADAFVLPSYSEGLPMSILEAWSYELPVIMTRECNLPIGFESRAAWECRPELESLVSALEHWRRASPEECLSMGQNGLALVRERFTWGKIANDFDRVYGWLLGVEPEPSNLLFP